MKLSGVDPGIIRELSGIYKPFIKAFKELISNAFDADAAKIAVTVDPELASIEVVDDGIGMTPFDFHRDFTRLGGSSAWLRGGRSPGGRERIGYKGIGFLAVARYCSQLHVESHATRTFKGTTRIAIGERQSLRFTELAGEALNPSLLARRLRVTSVSLVDGKKLRSLRTGRDYVEKDGAIAFRRKRSRTDHLEVSYTVDCRDLLLRATLDFDYLLGLEHRADLRLLDDFCTVRVGETPPNTAPYTKIRLHGLKDFVARELGAPQAKGKARNVAFKSGKDQFLWRLARSAPIRDDIPDRLKCAPVRALGRLQEKLDLPELVVKWRHDEPVSLRRPIYLPRNKSQSLEETVIPVDVRDGKLRVQGYILARSEVVYPAELRGLGVRVRNVMIGDASFLGWETLMSGPRKAAISQISGELFVTKGLDASDAINPGRESFYEESHDYRALRRALFGSDATIGGLVGDGIRSILDRIRVRSQVTDRITEARLRRQTLEAVSSAVNHYSRANPATASALARFFSRTTTANGLGSAKSIVLRPDHKIAGFEVQAVDGLQGDFELDFKARRVRLDFSKDIWNTTVYLDGHFYELQLKQGKPDQPICEFDNEKRRILVNWTHPAKAHMDDVGFLKSAILLRLASHAAPKDANAMMDLALSMLAFRAE